jgi:hypothetical protein
MVGCFFSLEKAILALYFCRHSRVIYISESIATYYYLNEKDLHYYHYSSQPFPGRYHFYTGLMDQEYGGVKTRAGKT